MPRRKNGPVVTRQATGRPGWNLRQARSLVHQGYSPEHAAKVTGYPEAMLRAEK